MFLDPARQRSVPDRYWETIPEAIAKQFAEESKSNSTAMKYPHILKKQNIIQPE